MCLLVILFLLPGQVVGAAEEVPAKFAGGSGTADDPYLIASAQQLARVNDYLSAHFKLIADIDLNVAPYNTGQGWKPIGSGDEPFAGSFDGNGRTIRGLYINRPAEDDIGLFAALGEDATLRGIRLEDVRVKGKDRVGGLVGCNNWGEIENCYASGSVAGASSVGGLVGENSGDIANSSSAC